MPNCWLVHHMGHGEKRPRGASAMLGWSDVNVTLMRSGDESTGQRSIKATGRDVSQKKRDLAFDATTHRFSLVPVGQLSFTVGAGAAPPKSKAVDDALMEIVGLLKASSTPLGVPMIHQLLIDKGVRNRNGDPYHQNTIRDALKTGVATGAVKKDGPSNNPTYSVP